MVWERRSRVKKEEQKNSSSLGRAVLWAAACAGNRMEVSPEGEFGSREMVKPNQGDFCTQRGSVGENGTCKAKGGQESESKTSPFLVSSCSGQGQVPLCSAPSCWRQGVPWLLALSCSVLKDVTLLGFRLCFCKGLSCLLTPSPLSFSHFTPS